MRRKSVLSLVKLLKQCLLLDCEAMCYGGGGGVVDTYSTLSVFFVYFFIFYFFCAVNVSKVVLQCMFIVQMRPVI